MITLRACSSLAPVNSTNSRIRSSSFIVIPYPKEISEVGLTYEAKAASEVSIIARGNGARAWSFDLLRQHLQWLTGCGFEVDVGLLELRGYFDEGAPIVFGLGLNRAVLCLEKSALQIVVALQIEPVHGDGIQQAFSAIVCQDDVPAQVCVVDLHDQVGIFVID